MELAGAGFPLESQQPGTTGATGPNEPTRLISESTHIVIIAKEGVIIKEWKGMIEGCASFRSLRTIFISFHLQSAALQIECLRCK